MAIQELRSQFIMDEDALRSDLEFIVEKLLHFCSIDKAGRVHLKVRDLKATTACRIVLSAKRVGGELENSISKEASVQEIVDATGLPRNQARARLAELVDDNFAETTGRGFYRANLYKVREFAGTLAGGTK